METRSFVPRNCALALLDRLPALLERREVPSLALAAHDPQRPFAASNARRRPTGNVLDGLVATEVAVTEQTGRVHRLTPACEAPDGERTRAGRRRASARPRRRSPSPRRPRRPRRPRMNAPTTCAIPTTTRLYAAIMRPRSSSGTTVCSSPLEMAPLRIIVLPMREQQQVAEPRRCGRSEKASSSMGHVMDATMSSFTRETRRPRRRAPSAPVMPPMPRQDEQHAVAAGAEREHVARHDGHERQHRRAEDGVDGDHQHQRAHVGRVAHVAHRLVHADPRPRVPRRATEGGQPDHEQPDEHGDEAHRVEEEAPRDAESGDDGRGDAGPDDAREIEAARVERDGFREVLTSHEVDVHRLARGDLDRGDGPADEGEREQRVDVDVMRDRERPRGATPPRGSSACAMRTSRSLSARSTIAPAGIVKSRIGMRRRRRRRARRGTRCWSARARAIPRPSSASRCRSATASARSGRSGSSDVGKRRETD